MLSSKYIISGNQKNSKVVKTLDRIQENIKYYIFMTLYNLLKNDYPGYFQIVILTTIEYLQLILFCFTPSISNQWNNKIFSDICFTVLNKLDLIYYSSNDTSTNFIVIFYICFFICLVIMINFIYVSIIYSNTIQTSNWLVKVLKYSIKVFISVLIIPFLKMFFSIFKCIDLNSNNLNSNFNTVQNFNGTENTENLFTTNNEYYLEYSNSIKCFKEFYFLHMFISIICIIFIIIFGSIISSSFYDYSLISFKSYMAKNNFRIKSLFDIRIKENIFSKYTSSVDMYLFYSKLILVVIFVLVPNDSILDNSNNLISDNNNINYSFKTIIIVQFIISLFILVNLITKKPYFNAFIYTYVLLMCSLWTWTCFSLFSSSIFGFKTNVSIVIIWLCGSILLALAIVIKGISKYSLKTISSIDKILDFSSPELLVAHIRYLLMLISSNNRETEIITKGFIRSHEDTCYLIDCPLKIVKRSMDAQTTTYYNSNINTNNNNNNNNVGSNLNSLSDNNYINNLIAQQMLVFINKLYIIGLYKFPNSIHLRLNYSIFLYQLYKQKLKAKQELESSLNCNPSLNQQFIIFRYKKMISEDLDTNQNQSEILDVVSSIAYETYYRQLHNEILSVAKLFIEFWSVLSTKNASPDIFKLNSISLKVNESIKNIQSYWKRLQSYKANNPKAYKMYAMFYFDILNNKEKGKELISLSKELNNRNYIDNEAIINIEDDFSNGQCSLVISAEVENYGSIIKISANACKIFGYIQEDLTNGKSFDELFLDCYNGSATNFINKETINWTYNKSKIEYTLYSKHKTNKTIPVLMKILDPNKTIDEKNHIKLIIKPMNDNFNDELKELVRCCYIVFSENLAISNTSDSIIEVMDILNVGKNSNYTCNNLINLFPELLTKFDLYEDQESKNIYYFININNI